jgi:hypothetical protein
MNFEDPYRNRIVKLSGFRAATAVPAGEINKSKERIVLRPSYQYSVNGKLNSNRKNQIK